MRRIVAAVLAAAVLLAGCTPEPAPAPAPVSAPATAAAPTPAPQTREELRAEIASLLIVGVTTYDEALENLRAGAGGIFLPSWSDPGLLTTPGRDIAALRQAIGRDFEVAIDFEGGRVQRHSQVLGSFPAPGELAALPDSEIEATGARIGASLAGHGITVDFAPVLDVDTAGLSVIGDRAFGTDPATVARKAAAFARGLSSAGITPVYKHFPGHGAASGDTHLGPATTPPLAELESLDLAAYGPALAATPGAGVMVGHLVIPGLSTGTLPSSLDPAVYELLRSGEYPGGASFSGRVYTDDLAGMVAISARYTPQEAAKAAIAAGADRALWSTGGGLSHAVDLIEEGVRGGEIPAERIAEAAAR